MKSTFLYLSTALILTLSSCGGAGSSSSESKLRDERIKLKTEHNDLEADHTRMEQEFSSLDAKYRSKVKEPDSTYLKMVAEHKLLLDQHSGILKNHTILLENLDHFNNKPEKEVADALKSAIEEDKRIEQSHKEMHGKHDNFIKIHQDMLKKVEAPAEKK